MACRRCAFTAAILVLALIVASAAARMAPPTIRDVEVSGTILHVALSDGRTLEGRALQGAVLDLSFQGERDDRHVRIDRIIEDPSDRSGDVLLYDMTVVDESGNAQGPLCEDAVDAGHWVFPLRGQWDRDGQHVSDAGWTLVCAADALGKCVRFGYKPWKTAAGTGLAEYHQACVRMVRADYCGNQGTTRDGMLIDLYDRLAINPRDPGGGGLRFEAAWNAHGAICVAHTRVPERMTLARLGQICPPLRGRLGPAACSESLAESGRLGEALLFNRSK